MRADLLVVADRCMKDMNAVAIDVPVGESGFLATAVGAALKNLRAHRKDSAVTVRRDLEERSTIKRHVVVHQVHPVMTHPRKTSRNRGTECERLHAMDELYGWKRGAHAGVC